MSLGVFFFSSRRRHTRLTCDWSSDVCSSDLPSTGAFYRCALALPVLWPLSWLEDRKYGPRPLRQRALAWLAGVLFALDLVAWHYGIEQVGAGLATVLGNLQVVFVGLLAWVILSERP